jgi:serine/threonine-protein kinase RsbW
MIADSPASDPYDPRNSTPRPAASANVRLAIDERIPSDVRFIEAIVARVASEARHLDFSARQCSLNVRVALTEAISNAILYGNGGNAAKEVRVRAAFTDTSLVLEVEDEGPGFDLERCLVDPTTPEMIERENGRGLFLMEHLMDHVERFIDGGNVVRLTLRRP